MSGWRRLRDHNLWCCDCVGAALVFLLRRAEDESFAWKVQDIMGCSNLKIRIELKCRLAVAKDPGPSRPVW